MQKPISPTAHGVVDYAFVAASVVLPRLLGWDEASRRTSDLVAGTALLSSMMTDYRLGVFRVLPMKAHLALDAVQTTVLTGAAARAESDNGRAGLLAMATFGSTVSALTRTDD